MCRVSNKVGKAETEGKEKYAEHVKPPSSHKNAENGFTHWSLWSAETGKFNQCLQTNNAALAVLESYSEYTMENQLQISPV